MAKPHHTLVALTITTASMVTLPPAALAAAQQVPVTKAPVCANADATPATTSLPVIREAVTCLLSAERANLGVRSVKRDGRLAKAGARQAGKMVRGGYFAHVGPDGETLTQRLRLARWTPRSGGWDAGEILAYGAREGGTPQALVAAWIKSPSHFSVLRDKTFTQIGVGLVRGTPSGEAGGITAAVEFGRR